MTVETLAPLYSGATVWRAFPYLASCGRWYALRYRRAFLSSGRCCCAHSCRLGHIHVAWFFRMNSRQFMSIWPNMFCPGCSVQVSMLQNPSLLLTHSFNDDGCVFNNRLRSVVSRNLIATNAAITARLSLFHCARKCSFSRMVLLRSFACSPVRVASIFSAVSISP